MEQSHQPAPRKFNSSLFIPIAIVIAGALIAAAIVFKPSPNQSETGSESANSDQVRKSVIAIGTKIGLNKNALTKCIDNPDETKALIEADMASGEKIGIQGTPFLIFEFPQKNGSMKTMAVPGAIPREAIQQIIKDQKLPEGFPNTPVGEYPPVTSDDHLTNELAGAKAHIIEYSDLDCPYCHKLHPELEAVTSADTSVVWAYRQFPLVNLHPNAYQKALASECVAKLGGSEKFFSFIHEIMK